MDSSIDSRAESHPPAGDAPRGRLLGNRDYAALGLGGLLLLALVATSAWLSLTNRAGLERAARTRAVVSELNDVATAILDAETGQRGYLLSGKDSYLQPYRNAVAQLPQALDAAAAGLPPGSALRPKLEQLRAQISTKVAELAETVRLAQSGDRAAAMALVDTDVGKNTMDSIRRSYQALRADQLAVFVAELSAVNRRGRDAVVVGIAGLLGVLAMAGFVASSLRRTLGSLRRAQAALGASNAELAVLNTDLERRVGERTAELTEANEEIQRFAYIVSHDLRAPLVNIMGFTAELEQATGLVGHTIANLAEREPVPREVTEAATEDLPEAVRFIKASTSKMDRLIGAILKLSREGRRVVSLETVDMNALLAGIVDALQHQAQTAGAEVAVADLSPVQGDRLVLEQIFGNLIDNALKYLAPGRPGRIRVDAAPRGAWVVFSVADNGRGIAQRDRDRVFELFRRAGDQTVAGEGIGLAHVRALVRRLGGRIDLDSTEGVGTTFRVFLPVRPTGGRGVGEGRSAAA